MRISLSLSLVALGIGACMVMAPVTDVLAADDKKPANRKPPPRRVPESRPVVRSAPALRRVPVRKAVPRVVPLRRVVPALKRAAGALPAKVKATARRAVPVVARPPSRRLPVRKRPAVRQEDQPIMLGGPEPGTRRKAPAKRRTTPVKVAPSRAKPPKRAPARRRPAANRQPAPQLLPQVNVIGRRPAEFDSIPGSADVVDQKTLKSTAPVSASEALREVTGVHITDEDGSGLRLNVGFRGLDPVRSRKILVLEDGVPISMAPYGEPEMYYTPNILRMKRLEVVKGSGSILWGPQTIGGVLNLVTKDPPRRFRLRGAFRYGNFDYFVAHASVGNTVGRFGYLFEVIHQRLGGFNKLNLAMTDISTKLRFQINSSSVVGLKLHFYDEFSHSTYLGLTTPQFQNDPTQNHATFDRFPVRRYALSLSHQQFFGRGGLLTTTLYAHNITRFWKRQDFDRSRVAGRQYERVVNGSNQVNPNAPNDGSSIFFRDSTGNRNREFTVAGLDARYTVELTTGPVAHEIMAGLRFHAEQGDEQYLIGENAKSPSGVIRDHETRHTLAMAAYLQYRLMFFKRKLRITPGFRFELMNPNRHLFRTRALVPGSTDRVIKDVDIRESSLMMAPIPGLGVSLEAAPGLNLFTGIHRGFAPPRTKDSITADGEDLELAPEYSWNAELGLRYRLRNFLSLQAAGFFLYFENQVIPPSESSGAVATDPNNAGKSVINGGQTLHAGAEASVLFDLPAMLNAGFNMPLLINYTWVPVAQFGDGRFVGNRLPYAPEHMLTARLRFFHRIGLDMSVTVNFVSSQTADKGETITPSIDGLVGQIDARVLLDARIGYTFRRDNWSIGAFVAGKNLTNSIYITSRRPSGIKVGTPLQIFGGIQGSL